MDLHFRKAEMLDCERLLTWRNDPVARENSINTDLVHADEHEKWLKSSLANQDRTLLIAEVSGQPVGTVRLDRQGNKWELSWNVAPSARGKGVGKEMVRKATELVAGDVIAQIKENNTASLRIAEFVGFAPVRRDGTLIQFYLKRSEF